MLLVSLINGLIPSGSGKGALLSPIIVPIAIELGLTSQTAVLAYCFGDGFSDMFWPTACTLNCGLMGVPLDRWYRFMAPLFLIMVALQTFFIALSVVVYP